MQKIIDFTQYPSEDTIKKNIADRKSNVRVQTEVKNDSDEKKEVQVIQKVEDADGKNGYRICFRRAYVKSG